MQSIYDTQNAQEISINTLIKVFIEKGCSDIYFKNLSPNDNSKNQPYMGSHLSDLSFLPTGDITESSSSSNKTQNPKRQVKYSVELNFVWVSSYGDLYPAPKAKFIYYPQYPEVRLSGFVTGCGFNMNGWMDPNKLGRSEGRVLIFAVSSDKRIYAYLATPYSRIAQEINTLYTIEISSVIKKITTSNQQASSKDLLLLELKRIHQLNWIESKRLNKQGSVLPYKAQNGGGYTLEAELGIKPNGYSDPDFLGWEIKQFGVKRCDLINSKALTLMTPEPDGGFYSEQGVEAFMYRYGYENARIEHRLDFTGIHQVNKFTDKTGLTLTVNGYDLENNQLTNASGNIALIDSAGNIASLWSFNKLMQHWNKKHAKAAYIPSFSIKDSNALKSYHYCKNIRLFEGTSFLSLLQAFASSHVYYDPGIKLENTHSRPTSKRRSQFRIKSKLLSHLYSRQINIDVNDI